MADKAFLSGINNYKTISDLRGCVSDTESLKQLLVDAFDFDEDNIRVKTDDEVTKSVMDKGWKWLLRGAKPGDRLVFHFSGHGSYTADLDGETGEADCRDELLCLYGMAWDDPSTYLLDDELAEWTKKIPDGVHVTFLLDCCHSGTATRMIKPELSRAVRGDYASASAQSLDEIAIQRAQLDSGRRSRSAPIDVRPELHSEIGKATVLARFVQPPAEIDLAVEKARKSRSFRELMRSTRSRSGEEKSMNHVLWSGCRDDQTSADAYIDNDFHGAFTYHFCQAARMSNEGFAADRVIKTLRQSLKRSNFSQVPQLEPDSTTSILFGGDEDERVPSRVDGDDWSKLLEIMQQIADHLGVSREQPAVAGSATMRSGTRSLVYVHGICKHESGYSDDWFDAMAPHLAAALRVELNANRKEVLWSEHVSRTSRSLASEIDPLEMQQTRTVLEAVLAERMVREAGEQIAEREVGRSSSGLSRDPMPPGAMPRALFGIPGLDCIDDFVKYLSSDRIRKLVIGEATDVLRPLLERGDSVELVSHSWGTIVAYEALHVLSREGLRGRVKNWFTVGAALSIGYVAKQLRPSSGHKPAIVNEWTNLDARGDGVGGSIRATGMHVDQEFLRLDPHGCKSTFGLVSPACAHSSYFQAGNDAVNRDIFARFLKQT
ncbi:caspase family protein [Allorhodopirellula solitaria]|uniref:Caspase domain protein n=1 Tax=Allorhodopirellula solitaria TaxID=2527987 RepID=A0A5C5WYR4_9BACT|nr:caspase family protein [Allorhodopirellula solitaria]TWT55221.1 Caspase domain protein [Allorhodopirellula solitaria]